MIVSFSTQLNKKPTYFVEKIHKCFADVLQMNVDPKIFYPPEYSVEKRYGSEPKLHTIRKDVHDRLVKGVPIDFFINARTKSMFRFAPRIPITEDQEIFMTRRGSLLEMTIAKQGSYIGGDDFYVDLHLQETIAINDGFDDYDSFRDYFIGQIELNGRTTGNYWFKGKLVHYANLIY